MCRCDGELLPCKVFDFGADDGDATFVGGVELEDARFHELGAVELFCEGEDCGGFACAGGPVEEHVWKIGGLEGTREDLDGIVLGGDFGECLGTAVSPC